MSTPNQVDELLQLASTGTLSRRSVLKRGLALGLTAPALAALLAACGDDDDPAPTPTQAPAGGDEGDDSPTEEEVEEDDDETGDEEDAEDEETGEVADGESPGRGLGGQLRLLFWQAPTILNQHFSQGDKDSLAARLVNEPLISFDADGKPVPVLAAEIPTLENGGVAEDGMSVTYKLKEGVVWSDGEPFTAEDVRFTWEFATNPENTATSANIYGKATDVEIIDDYTVKLHFAEANPGWITMYAGSYYGQILPKHILEEYVGTNAREAPFNMKPIGTGPFKVREFRPGDVVLYDMNENFREPNKPFFSEVELKGGGDAVSAARAVVQLGETDYAWNLQIEKDVMEQLKSQSTEGYISSHLANSVEQLLLNFADPNTEIDGARSEPGTTHPYFSDENVRLALRLATDRDLIATQLYGEGGKATANTLVGPTAFASPNTVIEFDLDRAAQMLEDAGWVMDGGVRKKDGVELKLLFTSTNASIRQRTQEILKQSWEEIGFKVEIKAIDSSVYFSTDAGNPDTVAKFYADVTMYGNGTTNPFPIDYMAQFLSIDPAVHFPQKANNWSGRNYMRWSNEEFNKTWVELSTEMDYDKQAEGFIKLNDLVVNGVARVGLVQRSALNGFSNRIKGHNHTSWDASIHDIKDWYAEE
jgi:peptide/nickel transport system substrate-binding protein